VLGSHTVVEKNGISIDFLRVVIGRQL
jgi:hypothetical protein